MSRAFAYVSFFLSALLVCGLTLLASPPAASSEAAAEPQLEEEKPETDVCTVPEISWFRIAEGMELGLAELPESKIKKNGAAFVLLRIEPGKHAFALQMASEEGRPLSLAGWSQAADLRAGINASMYLPDNITSTGYMRSGDKINNPHIGSRLGAFFVAGPRTKEGKRADILEHESPDWRGKLALYDIVVQNYRLISSRGKMLWSHGGQEHSIAVVATDADERILFVLSQEPLSAWRFALYLKSFPLSVKTVMYVEGGVQSGIFVRLDDAADAWRNMPSSFAGATAVPIPGGTVHVWKGRQNLLNIQGNPHAVLPNVIGVRR